MEQGRPPLLRRLLLGKPLSEFDPRRNGGQLLYLLFALAVVVSHSVTLGGYSESWRYGWSGGTVSYGTIAVIGFLFLSGYLLARSWKRIRKFTTFMGHRVVRVLPAYWVALLGTAFVFAPFAFWYRNRTLEGFNWYEPGGATSYLLNNFWLRMDQAGIQGTLTDVPLANAWNGSLWSVLPQFTSYVLLALLAPLIISRPWAALSVAVFLGIYTGIQWYSPIFPTWLSDPVLTHFKLNWITNPVHLQLVFAFFLGVAAQVCARWIRISWGLVALTLGVMFFSFYELRDWMALGILCSAYLILAAFCFLTRPRLPGFLTGLSFGIYLWAFPITQVLVVVGFPARFGPFGYVGSAILLSVVAAWVTHRVVEAPLLRLTHPKSPTAPPVPLESTPPVVVEAVSDPDPATATMPAADTPSATDTASAANTTDGTVTAPLPATADLPTRPTQDAGHR